MIITNKTLRMEPTSAKNKVYDLGVIVGVFFWGGGSLSVIKVSQSCCEHPYIRMFDQQPELHLSFFVNLKGKSLFIKFRVLKST